ncbi:MAG: hypothetical protein E5299_01911 [Burkholderia gladioli]|nr:MAG: hypothetical protein E5299_01911 [Burkholderia gladioli]
MFLIFDKQKVHHAKSVKAWFAEHLDKFEVFYLPSYGLELNPDEMFNANLKANVTKQATAREPRGISRKPSSAICVALWHKSSEIR